MPATDVTAPNSAGTVHTLANGVPGGGAPGGGGGGGGAPTTGVIVPNGPSAFIPNPTVDAAAAYLFNGSAVNFAAAPNNLIVNYDRMQNLPLGGISFGASRTAQLFVYNISKKTALTISAINIVGANPGDFTISAADISRVLATTVPANKNTAVFFNTVFSPTGEGARAATLQITTNAGVFSFILNGTGLANRPIIGLPANFSVSWCTATNVTACTSQQILAPDDLQISNSGGQALIINSLQFIGANPTAFTNGFVSSPSSNCFAGEELAPHSFCFLTVGPTDSATAPANAVLQILTNDPITPEVDINLSLTP